MREVIRIYLSIQSTLPYHIPLRYNSSQSIIVDRYMLNISKISVQELSDNFSACYFWEHSFIHSVFCLTTGPKPPPKPFLHIVRSSAFSFKWEYPLLSLRSSRSFLHLLPRLLVTSISHFIFPSITCFRRQFLRKMWPIQLGFRFLISCRIFLCSLTYLKIMFT